MARDPEDLVSVVIPAHNCEKYLAEAIESVIAQTCGSVEIIVVDDGSTDGSADVAATFASVQYHHQPQQGAAVARNRGAELAKGTFLAFLDADDIWMEDKLQRQLAAFEDHPELDIVFGMVHQFHSPELDEEQKRTIHCPPEPMPGYLPSAVMMRRDAFSRVGPFETNWQIGEFVSWYSRAKDLGLEMMMLPEVVTRRRLHTSNLGVRKRQAHGDYARILKAALDRRRAGEGQS